MDADPPVFCIASSSPKSVVLPADAIVIYSITLLLLVNAPNTPLVELETGLTNGQNSVQGAIRKMNFFTNQYDNLMKKIGKEELTEEDYELEEARYHIMTCMKQALNSARPRGGQIDEGNLIYLFDLGINAAQAQAEVFAYLQWENQIISEGKAPEHEATVKWLESCADKWAGCPAKFANSRGFDVFDPTSLTNVPRLEAAE